MRVKSLSFLTILAGALLGGLTLGALAEELTVQEVLDQLKSHQDQIQTIEADFSMTVFGVAQLKLEQSGTYTYTAPDQVVLEVIKPQHQVIKMQGKESFFSMNVKGDLKGDGVNFVNFAESVKWPT